MRLDREEAMEDKVVVGDDLSYRGFVVGIQVKYTSLTAHLDYIFDHVIGLCFSNAKVVFIPIMFSDEVDKSFNSE